MQPRGTGVDLLLPVLPFAAMAAVAAVELSAGPEVGYLALFSIGPAFACVSGTVRRALLVGARMERALDRRLEGEEFVSAVLAEIAADGAVTLLDYGHPPPLVVRADGAAQWAEPARCAPPLGLAALGPAGPEAHGLRLGTGDQLLLYTDGVTETRDRTGEFYPLLERSGLLSVDDPDGALEALRRDVAAYAAGPLKDDAAMMLLRRRSDERA
ncbi:PP2C family protein-serine/threonine phosphatase [Kitasatospora cineracea]|uniref:PP2C family protein-serine/threonine phosphatase n=1 Tax=Kitasatospora cineracea TaxID=88074 RepID=UPI000F4D7D24|nr:PP2C family protein-serine/threonine phosphatase [Kitasatospora cineracea]